MLLRSPSKKPASAVIIGTRASSMVPLIHYYVHPETVLLLGCSQPITEHCMCMSIIFVERKSPGMGLLAQSFHIGLADTVLELHCNLIFTLPISSSFPTPYKIVRPALQLCTENSSCLLLSNSLSFTGLLLLNLLHV